MAYVFEPVGVYFLIKMFLYNAYFNECSLWPPICGAVNLNSRETSARLGLLSRLLNKQVCRHVQAYCMFYRNNSGMRSIQKNHMHYLLTCERSFVESQNDLERIITWM